MFHTQGNAGADGSVGSAALPHSRAPLGGAQPPVGHGQSAAEAPYPQAFGEVLVRLCTLPSLALGQSQRFLPTRVVRADSALPPALPTPFTRRCIVAQFPSAQTRFGSLLTSLCVLRIFVLYRCGPPGGYF